MESKRGPVIRLLIVLPKFARTHFSDDVLQRFCETLCIIAGTRTSHMIEVFVERLTHSTARSTINAPLASKNRRCSGVNQRRDNAQRFVSGSNVLAARFACYDGEVSPVSESRTK